MTTSQYVFRRRLCRLIAVPVTVSLPSAEPQVHSLIAAPGWVEHTDIVLAGARLLRGLIIDQETGVRGYVLSRDRRFFQPYQTASDTFSEKRGTTFREVFARLGTAQAKIRR